MGDFPEAERAAVTSLSLPIYPELSSARQEAIVSAVGRFYG
jgi:dTDP-4-amino-4,6-dideoxygalactose transaminase